jgi:hypothetical protein
MRGFHLQNSTGTLQAGIEIVPESLLWRTASEIDDLVMEGGMVSNHIDFWNAFCALGLDQQAPAPKKMEASNV